MTRIMSRVLEGRDNETAVKKGPPVNPKHPERICWGCDTFCPADDLACGNGTIRTLHPVELFGEDWLEWAEGRDVTPSARRTSSGA